MVFALLALCGQVLAAEVAVDPSGAALVPGLGINIISDNNWTTTTVSWTGTEWDTNGDLESWTSAAMGTPSVSSRMVSIPNSVIPKDGAFHVYRIDMGLETPWLPGIGNELTRRLWRESQQGEYLYTTIGRLDPSWWQVPSHLAPQAFAYTVHPLTPIGTGAVRVVRLFKHRTT